MEIAMNRDMALATMIVVTMVSSLVFLMAMLNLMFWTAMMAFVITVACLYVTEFIDAME
tara:strand:- start:31 stop:207 length:177 start_codon:yes stop_codon:yes gene_type:complete